MDSKVDIENRINTGLGTVLRYFNFLELNLGLSIRHLENPDDVDKSHSKLNNMSFQEKLDKLIELLKKEKLSTNIQEIESWYLQASDIRCIRNYYVHGIWEYLPTKQDQPLGFRLPPWRKETLRGEKTAQMSIDDFEQDAEQIKNLFDEFMSLRRNYGF